MKKQYRLLLFLILTCSFSALSQNIGKIWYFGQYAGMNFNTMPPTPLIGSMISNKGCATLTNSVDNTIIAYTDGKTLYNKNHQITPNGSNLKGDGQASNSSYFLPYPNKPNTAILFTVDAWGVYLGTSTQGLYYSIVKVDSSTGLADVVPSKKNISLIKPTSEKLAVTKHANGVDYWVVTHGAASANSESSKYFAYLVTSAGVSTTPVVSMVGSVHNNPIGELNISPNGQKVCVTTFYDHWAELLDFNNSTGVVSNPVLFSIPRCLGVEFSPNSEYVYITETGPSDPNSIYQIDITTHNIVSIANTTGYYTYSQMATAPDGNIYVANFGSAFLGKIINPNGTNAAYIESGLPLASGTSSRLSVPYATEMPIVMCVTANAGQDIFTCSGVAFTLPSSQYSHTWTAITPIQAPNVFNDTKITLYNKTTQPQVFKFLYTQLQGACSGKNKDTLNVTVYPEVHSNPTQTIQTCSGTATHIGVSAVAGVSYKWSPTINLNSATVSNPVVTISNTTNNIQKIKYLLTKTSLLTGCKAVDTVIVIVPPTVSLTDTNICSGASIMLADSIQNQPVNWSFSPSLQAPDNFTNNVLTLYNPYAVSKKVKYYPSNISCADTVIVRVDKIVIDANGHLLCSDLFIPNIITKNGDGKNDFFKIDGLNLFNTNKLQIYNRWGKKVYEQTDYKNNWNGENLSSGTYFYLLELTIDTGKHLSYKGWLEVFE